MELADVPARRLQNLRLSGPPLRSVPEVVSWLGAVQSQDYRPAAWSIAQRATRVAEAEVDAALAAGEIVRTHALRPTWHFLAGEDVRWVQQATADRVHRLNAFYYRQAGLSPALHDRAAGVLVAALTGRRLTRAELVPELEAAGLAARGLPLAYTLMHAELEALLCSGGVRGRQQTYALLDEVVPPRLARVPEDPVAELVHRYVRSHGPAAVKDLCWWSSLTVAQVRAGIEALGGAVERLVLEGREFWRATPTAVTGPGPGGAAPPPRAHLLQAYDEYVVGYSETKWLLDATGVARGRITGRSIPNGVLVVDGQVTGAWRRALSRSVVTVDVLLYRDLDPEEVRAVLEAADRHAAFLGLRGQCRLSALD